VKEVIARVSAELDEFPKSGDEWTWVMLRDTQPDKAKHVADHCLKDETHLLERAINRRLNPMSATYAYREAWSFHIAGDAARADAVLERAAADGVPLPINPAKK